MVVIQADWTYRAGCSSHDASIRRFCAQALSRLDPFLIRNPSDPKLICLPSNILSNDSMSSLNCISVIADWPDNDETLYFPPLIEKRTPPPELESRGASVANKEEHEDEQEMSDTRPTLYGDVMQSDVQDRAPITDTVISLSHDSVLWQSNNLPKLNSAQRIGNPSTESANEKPERPPEKTDEEEWCDDRMMDSEGSLPEIDSGESDDAT